MGAPISIHALLAESDVSCMLYDTTALIFLSTLSLRRATTMGVTVLGVQHHFYPRSPCGERPPLTSRTKTIFAISIHALLAESDGGSVAGNWRPAIFLSTLSLRRATHSHAAPLRMYHNFYPRSPCGERHRRPIFFGQAEEFLSTLSLRRATINGLRHRWASFYFYPRSPCGERLNQQCKHHPNHEFLSTLSLRRATRLMFWPFRPC